MKKQEEKKKTLGEVMKEFSAVFSVSLRDGFANISFDDKGEMSVQFLNDEGYAGEDQEIPLKDIDNVSKFMEAMKTLKLGDYQQN